MRNEKLRKRVEISIGIGAPLVINIGLSFFPGFLWFIWLIQWVYVIPAIIVLSILKRRWLVAAMLIAAGSMMILDIAYCGYAASHGESFLQ